MNGRKDTDEEHQDQDSEPTTKAPDDAAPDAKPAAEPPDQAKENDR